MPEQPFIAYYRVSTDRQGKSGLCLQPQHEREQISQRTKDALAAAKRRGVILGRNGTETLSRQNHDQAQNFAQSLRATIEAIKEAGHRTVRAITAELNRRNIPTWRNATWHRSSTHALLKRIGQSQPRREKRWQ
jgi:DNA invertase Pin-like site-specific DNA recombinase